MERVSLQEIEELLLKDGEYVLPRTEDLRKFSTQEIVQFGHKHAMYTLPTVELIAWLQEEIQGLKAIEIGAGVGIIGKELGIMCTDNLMQTRPEVKAYYNMMGQPTIKYGKHVEHCDVETAVKRFLPDVVIGSWITHKFVDLFIGGNEYGPDEQVILDHCKKYIMLGNMETHGMKPIMRKVSQVIEDCPFYVSRSVVPEKDAIFVWENI